jgi:WD40 repeat protein
MKIPLIFATLLLTVIGSGQTILAQGGGGEKLPEAPKTSTIPSRDSKPAKASVPTVPKAPMAAAYLKHKLMSDSRSNLEMAFSPDGKIVAIGTQDRKVQLWDVELGELKKTLLGHGSAVVAVSFSPDGRTLASGSSDSTVKLWDVRTGELKSTLKDYRWDAAPVVFSPDGKLLAYSTGQVTENKSDHSVRILDAATLEMKLTLNHVSVSSITFSPDGESLAGADWQMMDAPKVFIWNTQTGNLKRTLNQSMPIYSIAFSSDGRTLACAGGDQNDDKGLVVLWDTQTWKSTTLASGTHIWSIAFSPDSRLLAGSDSTNVKIWNIHAATLRLTIKACAAGGQSYVAFSPDGKTLAHDCAEGFVKLWDVGGLE